MSLDLVVGGGEGGGWMKDEDLYGLWICLSLESFVFSLCVFVLL